jgi:hypothetical protein
MRSPWPLLLVGKVGQKPTNPVTSTSPNRVITTRRAAQSTCSSRRSRPIKSADRLLQFGPLRAKGAPKGHCAALRCIDTRRGPDDDEGGRDCRRLTSMTLLAAGRNRPAEDEVRDAPQGGTIWEILSGREVLSGRSYLEGRSRVQLGRKERSDGRASLGLVRAGDLHTAKDLGERRTAFWGLGCLPRLRRGCHCRCGCLGLDTLGRALRGTLWLSHGRRRRSRWQGPGLTW